MGPSDGAGSRGSLGSPLSSGESLIPAGDHEVGQGWEVTNDSHSGLGWRRCDPPGVPVVSLSTSCSLCLPRKAALPLPRAAVPGSAELLGPQHTWEQMRMARVVPQHTWEQVRMAWGQVRMARVVPAALVPGWVLWAVFGPCQLVRHVLQREHRSGEGETL